MSISGPLDGNGDPLPPEVATVGGADELEHEFDSECYFARHPEEIIPELSLGIIEWHAPLPTKLPLPATFQEAELEALAPRKPRPSNDESISDYFTEDKVDEVGLSVRMTEVWDEVKDDPIFREFPEIPRYVLSVSEVRLKYRDRPLPSWNKRNPYEATPEPSRQATPMTVDGDRRNTPANYQQDGDGVEQNDVLGDLEQALSANGSRHDPRYGSHSRAGSVSSQAGERISRPVPLQPLRDQAQEDILAALGVTGSPKMVSYAWKVSDAHEALLTTRPQVYQTPGPAFGAPPPEDQFSRSRQSSVTSTRAGYDPADGHRQGSSVHMDDPDATPRPKYDRMESSRKRSHGEYEVDGSGEVTPQQQRYKQARGDSYSG
jgi:hypothetical protein